MTQGVLADGRVDHLDAAVDEDRPVDGENLGGRVPGELAARAIGRTDPARVGRGRGEVEDRRDDTFAEMAGPQVVGRDPGGDGEA